jgi:hypothetical protein
MISIDPGAPRGDVCIEERYMRPTAGYPQGSWLYKIGDRVEAATGFYEKEYPGHPSLYFHGGPPFFMFTGTRDLPWDFSAKEDRPMKLRLEWVEFVDAAVRDLRRTHNVKNMPEFFPVKAGDNAKLPGYVEIEIGQREGMIEADDLS